jgi:hypothetical protein
VPVLGVSGPAVLQQAVQYCSPLGPSANCTAAVQITGATPVNFPAYMHKLLGAMAEGLCA